MGDPTFSHMIRGFVPRHRGHRGPDFARRPWPCCASNPLKKYGESSDIQVSRMDSNWSKYNFGVTCIYIYMCL